MKKNFRHKQLRKLSSVAVGIALYALFTGQTSAVSACDSVGDDDDAQTIRDSQVDECTVSPVLGIFSVDSSGSVDVTDHPSQTAVTIPRNNLDIFDNAGKIAATYVGVQVSSYGSGTENETHIDEFTNNGLITVTGGAGIAAVYNISGFIGNFNNGGTLSNDSVKTNDALYSDLTESDNYSTALYNLGSIDSVINSGIISAATGITNLTSSGIDNRIGAINNMGHITGTIASGILNEGNIGIISNSTAGTIEGAETGIANAGTISRIDNAGTLTGGKWAIYNDGTISNGIYNSGIINGSVHLGNTTLYIIGDSAAINGTVNGEAGSVFSVGDGTSVAHYSIRDGNPVTVGSVIIGHDSVLTLSSNANISTANSGSVANTGKLVMDESSTVTGNVNNVGTLSLAASSLVSATVVGNVFNSGSIVLNPTVTSAGNTLTVKGNYVGLPGSFITLGSVLTGDDSLTDRLVVTGNTSGSSTLLVENENGAGADTLDGIKLISIGGSSDATFSLANRVVAGAYDYRLRKGNVSGTDTSGWYLTSLYNDPQPATESVSESTSTLPSEQNHIYRPETAAYAANLQAANTLFTTSLRNRRGETRYIDPATGSTRMTSMWMRSIGGAERSTMTDAQNRTHTSRYVLMLGGDLKEGTNDGTDAFHVGLMGGMARAQNHTHNALTGVGARGSVDGYTTGVYATWFEDAEKKTGIWADSWVQYSWFSNEVRGDSLSAEHYNSSGLQASLETGYAWEASSWQSRYGISNRVFLEPHAQAVWSGIQADDHIETNGTRIQGMGNDNVATRLGMRVYLNSKSHFDQETVREFQPFAEANWLYNSQQYGVRMNTDTERLRGARNVAEFKTGVEGRLSENLSGYVAFTQQAGGSGYRYSEGSVLLSYTF